MARQALGKGLDALIPGSRAKTAATASAQKGSAELPINDIKPNPNQPRKHFTPEKMQEMIESVKKNGVITPILVKESGNKYELIAGERRFIAAQRAGLKMIPAVIKHVTPALQLELGLVENLMREDLNPIEVAMAYKNLMEEYKMTQEQVADKIGVNRASVANTVRILRLPAEVQQYIVNGDLDLGHAKVLAGVDDKNRQKALANLAVKKSLSVRELEALTSRTDIKKASSAKKPSSAEMKRVEDKMKLHFGTKVSVRGDYKKGRIEIEYYSPEDFERILEILKINI
jgi:ParB family chromosome partitioning protein